MKTNLIVKVQAPLAGDEVLIYSKDKSVRMLAPFDEEFDKLMGNSLKRFFYAKIENTKLKIGDEAPMQDW